MAIVPSNGISRLEQEIRDKQQANAYRELNVLLKGRLQLERPHEEREDYEEDGFAVDEDDPLERIDEADAQARGVEYQVVYKRVCIRKRPTKEGKVLGVALCGETFLTFDWDESMTWRKIHYKLRGGWGSLVGAWIMVRHEKIGLLMQPTAELAAQELEQQEDQQDSPPLVALAGPQGPPFTPVAATPAPAAPENTSTPVGAAELEDAARELEEQWQLKHVPEGPAGFTYASVDDLDEAAEHGGLQYRVVQSPSVSIRSLPGVKGKVVASLECQAYVDTFGWDEKKKYRKTFCRLNDASKRIIVAWVLVSHPELGPLLEVAAG